jgi:hypothetical protein
MRPAPTQDQTFARTQDHPEPALLPRYPGLSAQAVPRMHEAVRAHMEMPTGRLKTALEGAFVEIYQTEAIDPAWVRPLAAASANMETQAIASTLQFQQYALEEEQHRRAWTYRIRVEDEDDATKMTNWIIETIPSNGIPLAQIDEVLQEAVRLAKHGAFTPRGPLADMPGQPTVLPGWFQHRGCQTHWIDPRYPLMAVADEARLVRLI